MIKVIFKCNSCGHKEGTVITWDRDTVVECGNVDCKTWETMSDETDTE